MKLKGSLTKKPGEKVRLRGLVAMYVGIDDYVGGRYETYARYGWER